jgi:hypothetical protein
MIENRLEDITKPFLSLLAGSRWQRRPGLHEEVTIIEHDPRLVLSSLMDRHIDLDGQIKREYCLSFS